MRRRGALAPVAGGAVDVDAFVSKVMRAAQIAQLRSIAPCVAHALVKVESVHRVVARALEVCPEQTRRRLDKLPIADALVCVLGCLSAALYAPVAWEGGCDDSRGFDSPGNAWPQLAAIVKGKRTYNSRTLSRAFATWEREGRGFRRQRLDDEPVKCPRSGKTYPRRYVRNHVYLSAHELASWQSSRWAFPLVQALRMATPRWLWVETSNARQWRRAGLSYADTLTTSPDDLRERARERVRLSRRRSNSRRKGRRTSNAPSTTYSPSESGRGKDAPAARAFPKRADGAHSRTSTDPKLVADASRTTSAAFAGQGAPAVDRELERAPWARWRAFKPTSGPGDTSL